MPNCNKAIFMGRVVWNPDFRITPSGQLKANTAIAINHDWIDQPTGEKRSTVCFVDIEATGRNAKALNECFEKGSSIHVEGYLRYWKWEKENGGIRSKHDLMVESLYVS